MAAKPPTPVELRREGFRALVEALGPADAIRFLQQYDPGQGDYTAERHQWLDHPTRDDIARGIEQMEKTEADKRAL